MRMFLLREKEVINECTCRRLGYVCDIQFDMCTNCIQAIIIPGPAKFGGLLGHDSEYVIPVCCIKQIGEEIIIVEVNEKEVLHKRTC